VSTRKDGSWRYDGAWRKVRARVLERDQGRCQIRGPGCLRTATEVDHVVDVRLGGALYDEANCGACVGRAIGAVRTSGGSSSAGGVARRGSGEHMTICSRRQLKFLKLAALRKDALKAQIAGSAPVRRPGSRVWRGVRCVSKPFSRWVVPSLCLSMTR
jgi:hypothetical protein